MAQMDRRFLRCFGFFLYTKPTKHGNKTATKRHSGKWLETSTTNIGKLFDRLGDVPQNQFCLRPSLGTSIDLSQ